MRTSAFIALVILALASVVRADNAELGQALTLVPDRAQGARVYELCANCHKQDAWGHADGSFPAIAGQHRRVIIKQLADIRSRDRDAPTMYPFADPALIGGPQAIADVAEYIASLPPNPAPGTGSGEHVERGRELYERHCVGCHGHDGAGNDDAFFPRLAGQHYNYLATQLIWIRDGRRRNANWAMSVQLRGFDDRDIDAVADYISRLELP